MPSIGWIQYGADLFRGPSKFHEWLKTLGLDLLINKQQATGLNRLLVDRVNWQIGFQIIPFRGS